jgi:NhaA family Na+:H+ antiporter
MATDIAFVVGCLALLGNRVPHSLRVFLISLAVVDDVGAILIIAVAYTTKISYSFLALGILGIGLILLVQRLGVRSIGCYVLIGVGIWLSFHESGVHPTIAGVIMGLLTPVRPWISFGRLATIVQNVDFFLFGERPSDSLKKQDLLRSVELAVRGSISPVERLETALHPWVAFIVMPLFALANVGVPLGTEGFGSPITIAVIVGLVLGKPLGILLGSYLAVYLGWARLPESCSWKLLLAGGSLAGIGFTMSLFIADLGLTESLLDAAKIGVLVGSGIAGLVGLTLLVFFLPNRPPDPETTN